MTNLTKKLIIVLLITILAGVVYFFTIGKSSEEVGVTTSDTEPIVVDPDIAIRTKKILADTQEVSEYTLNDAIFGDKRFSTLKDYRVEIKDVRTGRENPFQPVN